MDYKRGYLLSDIRSCWCCCLASLQLSCAHIPSSSLFFRSIDSCLTRPVQIVLSTLMRPTVKTYRVIVAQLAEYKLLTDTHAVWATGPSTCLTALREIKFGGKMRCRSRRGGPGIKHDLHTVSLGCAAHQIYMEEKAKRGSKSFKRVKRQTSTGYSLWRGLRLK